MSHSQRHFNFFSLFFYIPWKQGTVNCSSELFSHSVDVRTAKPDDTLSFSHLKALHLHTHFKLYSNLGRTIPQLMRLDLKEEEIGWILAFRKQFH